MHDPCPIGRRAPGALLASLVAAVFLLLVGCQRSPDGPLSASETAHALKVLEAAPAHGISAEAVGLARLRALGQSNRPSDRRTRDRALRDAVLAYARAQHGLTIPPQAFPALWGVKPPPFDAEASLRAARKAGKFGQWLDRQPPPTDAYRDLQRGYLAYLRLAAGGGWPALPEETAALAPGARGPVVLALRSRLGFEDPALARKPHDPVFGPDLTAALARFQALRGLTPTGAMDEPTLRELNVSAIARAAQLRANLERLRWLPRQAPATRIDVNIAAAMMTYYADGRTALSMRSASGRPGDETPMLTSAIDTIVLNPPWNVPASIAENELLPKEAASPGHLAANGFVTRTGDGGARLVQLPGPESALGLVKFDFANPYAVYLHDTPAKAAFERDRRAVSHGCVRLERAIDLARMMLTRDDPAAATRLDAILASGETTPLPLKRPVPVRLFYLTAFPQDGAIAFRPDIYGWDRRLLEMLDARARGLRTEADKPESV